MEHLRSGVVGLLNRRDHLDCINDDGFYDENLCADAPFWWTRTGVIVKWSLFLGLTTIFFLYLLIGYLHAKSRLKKGLAPLGYHRFLVPRRDLARVDPRYQYPAATVYPYYPNPDSQGQAYGMQAMPPPPVYDPNAPRPPVYQYDVESGNNANTPPPGATKVDPSQNQAPVYRPADHHHQQAEEEYEAPLGPPPTSNSIPAQNTGNTNPFRG